jgi:cytochrome c oxidase cbb3-type subunit III
MKTLFQFLSKHGKLVVSGGFLIILSPSVHAAENQTVQLTEGFQRDVKILVYVLVLIAVLIGYIAIVLSAKDVKTLSFKHMWDGIIGRNSPDPEMHHEYDGIRELDNPMPAWLKFIFIGTIIFSGIYLAHYHFFGTGALSKEEYEIEMAAAAETYKSVELPDDQLIAVTDGGRLTAAAAVFVENCATCHRKDLGGESGPNLTDQFWLHGGTVKDIYHTITNGVPGKTMISWKDRIPSQERLAIASFILSKQGSNPANPRASEGVIAGGSEAAAIDTTVDHPSMVQPQ